MLILWLLACDTGPDYGVYTSAIRKLEARQLEEPCNTADATQLIGFYLQANVPLLAVDKARTFREQCPTDAGWLAMEYEATMAAKAWSQAVDVANLQIKADPTAYQPYQRRAAAYEGAENWASAVLDRREAFLMEPHEAEHGPDLAKDQEKAGELCDAWQTWGLVWWTQSRMRGQAQIERSRLLPLGSCGRLKASGRWETKMRVTPDEWFTFGIEVSGPSGKVPAAFGSDSSGPYTVIARPLASKLGIPLDGPSLVSRSFMGTSAGTLSRLPNAQLGEIAVPDLDVLVVDELPEGIDGMFGVNFLTRVDLDREDEKHWTFKERRF